MVEGDDTNEPIADTVRGILDGHIVLSRSLAQRNQYPAIDINASISRLMNDIGDEKLLKLAKEIRDILAIYNENYDLIAIGAYKKGSNPKVDRAIAHIDEINAFLMQKTGDDFSFEETLQLMETLVNAANGKG